MVSSFTIYFLTAVFSSEFHFSDVNRTALGVGIGGRLSFIERHWAYFMGFGIPYALSVTLLRAYVGYGLLFATFPAAIIIAAQSDYSAVYKRLSHRHLALPIFPLLRLLVGRNDGVSSGRKVYPVLNTGDQESTEECTHGSASGGADISGDTDDACDSASLDSLHNSAAKVVSINRSFDSVDFQEDA